MKPSPFAYHAPATLDEALHLLDTLDNARVIAGGQSLVPMLNFRVAQPDHLIDLRHIADLSAMAERDGVLCIGTMVTQRTLEHSPLVGRICPLLHHALAHVGHQQTRNRGTLGGSLCHLDPAAELPVAALALDPVLTVASRGGQRTMPFRDFPAGYLSNTLEPNEMLIRIDMPTCAAHAGCAFEEFARRPADFAIVSIAATLTVDTERRIEMARIAIGGLGGMPLRATEAEDLLTGQTIDDKSLDAAADSVRAFPSDGDLNNPAEYRLDLADALLRRALTKAYNQACRSHE
jgi:carbon-monoxide dehydrogenase medium subunit